MTDTAQNYLLFVESPGVRTPSLYIQLNGCMPAFIYDTVERILLTLAKAGYRHAGVYAANDPTKALYQFHVTQPDPVVDVKMEPR